jgi:hypothetical protein
MRRVHWSTAIISALSISPPTPFSTSAQSPFRYVRVVHVPMTCKFVDIFMKGLPTSMLLQFRCSLNIRSGYSSTAGGVLESQLYLGLGPVGPPPAWGSGPAMGTPLGFHPYIMYPIHLLIHAFTFRRHTLSNNINTSKCSGCRIILNANQVNASQRCKLNLIVDNICNTPIITWQDVN